MIARVRTPLPVRFWPKVAAGDPDVCWPWMGARSEKRTGTWRGVIRLGGRLLLAHRVALWLTTDPEAIDVDGYDRPDAPGLMACHRCNNRRCCNPQHLYWGTREDNEADRVRAINMRGLADAVLASLEGDA